MRQSRPLPETRLEAETGAPVHHIPMEERAGPNCCSQHVGSVCSQTETYAGQCYIAWSKIKDWGWGRDGLEANISFRMALEASAWRAGERGNQVFSSIAVDARNRNTSPAAPPKKKNRLKRTCLSWRSGPVKKTAQVFDLNIKLQIVQNRNQVKASPSGICLFSL